MAARKAMPAVVTGSIPQVNLMPRSAVERRERAALLRRWGWGLAMSLLAVAVVSAGAFALQATAQGRLAAEQTRTTDLLGQVAALQPVAAKIALQTELSDFRTQAMGADVTWRDLVTEIERALPAGIAITEYSLAPQGLPEPDVDPTSVAGVRGLLVLSGSSPTDMVDVIRDVRALPDVLTVDGWAQIKTGDAYRFELQIDFDQSVYTGDYAAEVAE